MIDEVRFVNVEWVWLALILSAVILSGLWVKEWVRRDRKQLLIRMLLSFFCTLLLAVMFLRPQLKKESKPLYAVILTHGYRSESLDSLITKFPNIEVIKYTSGLKEDLQSYSLIYLLGEGLPEYDLHTLQRRPVIYISGKHPDGVIQLKYTANLVTGEQLKVSGGYRNSKDDRRGSKILLTLDNNPLDSATLDEGETFFQVSYKTKVAGNELYFLVIVDSANQVIAKDPLPITITEQRKLQVLIINDFPTFETKYIKNFLAESGHHVTVRSRVTKGKYKFEFLNTNAVAMRRLNAQLLENIDLIIVDASSLDEFSNNELIALRDAIDQGLGLFIQPTENFFQSNRHRIWDNLRFKRDPSGVARFKSSVDKYPFVIVPDLLLEKIHEDVNGHLLTASYRYGSGKIGSSVLQNTYTLILKGRYAEYKQLWTEAIEVMTRSIPEGNIWKSTSQLPVAMDVPFDFELRTEAANPVVRSKDGVIPIEQDMYIPLKWRGRYWPRFTGWQFLFTEMDSTHGLTYYVTDTLYWQTLSYEQRKQKNSLYFHNMPNENLSPVVHAQWEEVHGWWLFCLFIFCVGYLWLEPKLS